MDVPFGLYSLYVCFTLALFYFSGPALCVWISGLALPIASHPSHSLYSVCIHFMFNLHSLTFLLVYLLVACPYRRFYVQSDHFQVHFVFVLLIFFISLYINYILFFWGTALNLTLLSNRSESCSPHGPQFKVSKLCNYKQCAYTRMETVFQCLQKNLVVT